MDEHADCLQSCAAAAGTIMKLLALLFVILIVLAIFVCKMIVAKRRLKCHKREERSLVETLQLNAEEAAENRGKELRLQALKDKGIQFTDLGNPSRMENVSKEIAEIATLSSNYRSISMRRRYLSRKIVCNTLAEVSRRHRDLKITALIAGSTQEGLGGALQKVQYIHAAREKTCPDDSELGLLQHFAKRPMFSSDMDVMVVPLGLSVGPNEDLEYEHVQSKPLSFVKLKPTAGGNLGDLRCCITDTGYLSAKAVKTLLRDALTHAKFFYCGPSILVALKDHGVAVEMKWSEPSAKGSFFEAVLVADFTFALHIPQWPSCACGWIERVRNWPSRHLTSAVAAGGCHAIAFFRDSSEDECQWRLSFSRAELILFSALPTYARDMCISLKALFKSRIRPFSPSLSSYHLKTVVLWIAEQAPSDLFSSSDSTAVALVKSLTLLRDNVTDGRMPHFFVSGHNVLPSMSSCEVKAATEAILDAAFYADFHLTRLRISEAKYFNTKDYLPIQLPGQQFDSDGAVQRIINRQLKQIMSEIPDVFDAVPIGVPEKPVLVHLLTGRVVKFPHKGLKFPHKGLKHTACLSKYDEILTAVEQETVNLVKGMRCGCTVVRNFKTAFAHEMEQGLVYITEDSLENASRYVKKVKKHLNACSLIIVACIIFVFVICGSTFATAYYCDCSDAINATEFSRTESFGRGKLYNSRSYGIANGIYNQGEALPVPMAGAITSGTQVLSDVSYRLPSYPVRGILG